MSGFLLFILILFCIVLMIGLPMYADKHVQFCESHGMKSDIRLLIYTYCIEVDNEGKIINTYQTRASEDGNYYLELIK